MEDLLKKQTELVISLQELLNKLIIVYGADAVSKKLIKLQEELLKI